MTRIDGGTSPAARIRAWASGTVHEVAIAFLAPTSDASASAAPGSTTMSCDVGDLQLVDPGDGRLLPVAGQHARGPRWPTERRGAGPGPPRSARARSAQVAQARTTAGVESIRVPSMSKMTASNTSSASRPNPTASSLDPRPSRARHLYRGST